MENSTITILADNESAIDGIYESIAATGATIHEEVFNEDIFPTIEVLHGGNAIVEALGAYFDSDIPFDFELGGDLA